jgi:diguanylate cyclase (GGDEF)-like protein
MFGVTRRRLVRILPLVVATLIVGVGMYFVAQSAIDGMEVSRAEYAAKSFGKYLIEEVPHLEAVIRDGKPDAAADAALGTIRPIGTVFKFRLYDLDGNLRIDSSPFAAGHQVAMRNTFQDLVARSVSRTGEANYQMKRGDGSFLPDYYSEIMVPLFDGHRRIGVLSVLSDETETWPELFAQFRTLIVEVTGLIVVAFGVPVALYARKLSQLETTRRRLRHTAYHDDLTEAMNRTAFSRSLGEQMEAARQRGGAVGVHIIDLDRFKDINETNGHAVGDEVLKQVAMRLRRLLGTRERLARLGADEFAILQPMYLNASRAVDDLATDVARALSQPFAVGGQIVQTAASVGYASFPKDGRDEAALMRAADVALHHAKQHRRGGAIAFDPSMEVERQSRHRIDARLRAALADGEFDLHFQPVVEAVGGRLKGFEALLRLNDEDGRPIPPSEFIPVAEEVGLIAEIGMWVLREACRVAREWPDELFVAVNLSPAQFAQPGMANRVRDALDWSGLKPRRLELEVTESLLITESDKVLRELKALKALGASLALDDFGTGYSSLSYVWRFPFDKLKVDRSFMADLTAPGAKSREILSTIIALGRVLNLRITAEGVETAAQAAVLRELNCDLMQGYLVGRPQPTTEVAATIIRAFGAQATSRRPGTVHQLRSRS